MNPISEVKNCDCLEVMRLMPSGFIDLAVCDFPYGIKQDGRQNHTRGGKTKFGGKFAAAGSFVPSKDYKQNGKYDNESPPIAVFNEVFRVSKNQIFFGANHFIGRMPYDSSCWIVLDKMNGPNDFADCELAWTSLDSAVRKFEFTWNGMIQGNMKMKQERIHPTEKPYELYQWILRNYAKPGDKILDPMMGSQSSRIAAYKMGFDFWGYEKDESYFKEGCARFEKSIAMPLFDAVEKPVQIQLF